MNVLLVIIASRKNAYRVSTNLINWLQWIMSFWRNRDPHFHYQLYYVISGECPKTHKYAYKKGKECCNTTKDCNDKPLKMNSDCCQYDDYKECPSKSCFNHGSGENLFLEVICKSKSVLRITKECFLEIYKYV